MCSSKVKYLELLSTEAKIKKIHIVSPDIIESNRPWAYFDGASQGQLRLGGVGGVLFVNEAHGFKFKAGLILDNGPVMKKTTLIQ